MRTATGSLIRTYRCILLLQAEQIHMRVTFSDHMPYYILVFVFINLINVDNVLPFFIYLSNHHITTYKIVYYNISHLFVFLFLCFCKICTFLTTDTPLKKYRNYINDTFYVLWVCCPIVSIQQVIFYSHLFLKRF